MNSLIEKITFFHGLKLRPIDQKMRKRWEFVIENKLLSEHGIKEWHGVN